MMDSIAWLSSWLSSHCNGDWEHENGVKIQTVDNPGWLVTIDVVDTELDHLDIDFESVDNGDSDWYSYKIKDKVFSGAGDLSKLATLLDKFRELVEAAVGT